MEDLQHKKAQAMQSNFISDIVFDVPIRINSHEV